jgi:hypothetical protein
MVASWDLEDKCPILAQRWRLEVDEESRIS